MRAVCAQVSPESLRHESRFSREIFQGFLLAQNILFISMAMVLSTFDIVPDPDQPKIEPVLGLTKCVNILSDIYLVPY